MPIHSQNQNTRACKINKHHFHYIYLGCCCRGDKIGDIESPLLSHCYHPWPSAAEEVILHLICMMTDIWEVWKDICHGNHGKKIKVKVLGPEPKKICVCAWGCWCANVSHIEKVWIGRCDVRGGTQGRCLSLGSQRHWMSYHGNYLPKKQL